MPLADLRIILRHLRRGPTTRAADAPFRRHVLAEYRRHRDCSDPALLTELRRRASDYALLVSGVEEQKRLRALDTGREVSEGIKAAARASAARSGLLAPEESDAPFIDLNRPGRDLNQ
mmetsp:Transcript_12096/g.35953  ORF Transcript_12096/g.35953 Transcript_12096/m.35953 type:complete len:118 (-) Transcript_12096:24-377(-)